MSQTVEIPGQGVAEFPDSMSPDEIKGVIKQKFYSAPESPTTPPAQEVPSFTQILKNAGSAAVELVGGMIPKNPDQYAKQLFPPLAVGDTIKNLEQGNFRDIPLLGRTQDIMEAEKTPPFSKERFVAGGRTLMDVALIAGVGKPEGKSLTPETDKILSQIGGENASSIANAAGSTQRQVRPQVGQETSLRQQGETTQVQERSQPGQTEPTGITETLAELNKRNGRAAELPTPQNKGLGSETLTPQEKVTPQGQAVIDPRFRVVGSRGRGQATPTSDYDLVTKLSPEDQKAWESTPEGEYPILPDYVKNAVRAGHDVFIETDGGHAWKVEEHPVSDNPDHFVVQRISQIEKNLLAGGPKPVSTGEPTSVEQPNALTGKTPTPQGEVTPQGQATGKVMFHGGSKIEGQFKVPAFFTDSAYGAKWFQDNRGGGGKVGAYSVETKNPLNIDSREGAAKLIEIAKKAGVDIRNGYKGKPLETNDVLNPNQPWDFHSPDIEKHSPYDGTNFADLAYIPKVQEALKSAGYDSLELSDTLENTSIPTTIVFDPSLIKPVSKRGKGPVESVSSPEAKVNWDKFNEDLIDNLDSFNPARNTGGRDYELADTADRFVEYAKNDTSGKPLDKLVSDFAKTDEAPTSHIRKLRQSVKDLIENDQVRTEPATTVEGENKAPSEGAGAVAENGQPPVKTSSGGAGTHEAPRVTSIKNAQVDVERENRGLPPVSPVARQGLGEAWDQAAEKIQRDPSAPDRLIDELKSKPRALTDVEDATLLHRQVDLQNQFHNAAADLTKALEAGDEAGVVEGRARTAALSDQLLELYNVGKRAGTETGRGLNARKMLAAEDFSLSSMITQKRAALGGKELTAKQSAEIDALNKKINELQKAVDDYQAKTELGKHFKELVKSSTAAAKESKGGLVKFLDEQANKARERFNARGGFGRAMAGIDPRDLVDHAIIGADYIANGAVKFGEWSGKMVGEFGEAIKPYLKDLYAKSKEFYDAHVKALAAKEDSRLKGAKTRMVNRTAELEAKLAAGDFTTKKRTPIELDSEGERLKGKLERAKNDFQRGLAADRARNRTKSQKFWDHFVGVERAMKLSSDVVLAKLTLAAAAREGILTPVEEVAGGAISKILPGLAKRAPREGGFSAKAEIQAKVQMLTKGMEDSWKNLQMQKSDLELLYGKKEFSPQYWYQYFGYLHGALKAPVKRAEFARSMVKRMEWAAKEGRDINSPKVVTELAQEAYVDANRSIFMQDNVVSQTFSTAMSAAERSKIAPNLGPAIARIGRFLIPIVKVPTNIVGEVATGVHGLGTGLVRTGAAYLKGIKELPPEQGDAIMRQLKKGAVGNALLLTGYFGYKSIGGFYHERDQREKTDVPEGRFRVGQTDLPRSASHSTGAMLLNIGATVHRVQDEQIKKSEPATKGLGSGVLAAGQGLAKELPFMPAITGISDAAGTENGFSRYIQNLITSSTSPGIVSHIARVVDTPGTFPQNFFEEPNKRKPAGVTDALKMGVPGLRQTVPEKTPKESKVTPIPKYRPYKPWTVKPKKG